MELKEEIATDEDEDLNQSEHENGTTLIPEDEIKEEITIDEHDNFTPCMQLLVKTELDPLDNKEQLSDVIVHDHNYGAAISTQPVTKSMVPTAQESPQPIMLISRVASSEPYNSSTPQTSFEKFSLNNKINKNMAMELQREKALNAKHKKTIDKLRQKVKMLNSRMRRRDLLVEKLQTEIKNMKS